jgi:hypothetical protein
MKIFKNVTRVLILLVTFACFTFPHVYGQSNESSELIFYRPAQSVMSGGAGVEIRVFINDQEIVSLPNGTMFNYTVYSQGALKIKFVAIQMGSTVGSPKVINLEAKHGETTAINVSFIFPKGAEAKIVNAKEHEKLKKIKWDDTSKSKEDINKPLIDNR